MKQTIVVFFRELSTNGGRHRLEQSAESCHLLSCHKIFCHTLQHCHLEAGLLWIKSGAVVIEFGFHSAIMGSIPLSTHIERLNKYYLKPTCLALSTKKGRRREKIEKFCLLSSRERRLTEFLPLYAADRMRSQVVYASCWPSPTKDEQTKHEFMPIVI